MYKKESLCLFAWCGSLATMVKNILVLIVVIGGLFFIFSNNAPEENLDRNVEETDLVEQEESSVTPAEALENTEVRGISFISPRGGEEYYVNEPIYYSVTAGEPGINWVVLDKIIPDPDVPFGGGGDYSVFNRQEKTGPYTGGNLSFTPSFVNIGEHRFVGYVIDPENPQYRFNKIGDENKIFSPVFTIRGSRLDVTSPVSGDVYQDGNSLIISWEHSNLQDSDYLVADIVNVTNKLQEEVISSHTVRVSSMQKEINVNPRDYAPGKYRVDMRCLESNRYVASRDCDGSSEVFEIK